MRAGHTEEKRELAMKLYQILLIFMVAHTTRITTTSKKPTLKTALNDARTTLATSQGQTKKNHAALSKKKNKTMHAQEQEKLEAEMRGHQTIITIINKTLEQLTTLEHAILSDIEGLIKQYHKKSATLDESIKKIHADHQRTEKKLSHKPTDMQLKKNYQDLTTKYTDLMINRDVHHTVLNTLKKIKSADNA